MARQYFYLVAACYDESCYPKKVFLQEHDAITWGRREAAKWLQISGDDNWYFKLYKQEINRVGLLQFVRDLKPYPLKPQTDTIVFKEHDDDFWGSDYGSDYDIDEGRC